MYKNKLRDGEFSSFRLYLLCEPVVMPCRQRREMTSKWWTGLRIQSLMAAKSCKAMYGILTKIQNTTTTTTSKNIP